MEIRRIVTGVLPDQSSVVLKDEASEPVSPSSLAGLDFYLLWGSEDGRSLGRFEDSPSQFWPGPQGTRFLVVRWAPSSEVPEIPGDPTGHLAETERQLPGLMGAFEPDAPGVHTSSSIDHGVCPEGEMWLQLDGDEGRAVAITPGT